MKRDLLLGALALVTAPVLGCRGNTSEKPPFHLIGDMDWQPKYRAEAESAFFADRRAQRPLVTGTIARGTLHDDDPVYTGRNPGSDPAGTGYVARSPIKVDQKMLERGQERFNIYCSPCHDRTGSGHGMVALRGFQPPPSDLTEDRVRVMPDGQIFDAITRGVRNMPSYAYQVPVEDRWAIVSWVRVLERSQHAKQEDVPPGTAIEAGPQGTTQPGSAPQGVTK